MYFILVLFLCHINTVIGPISSGPSVMIEEDQDRGPDTTVYNDGGQALQWHVGVYKKTTTPYRYLCGGTLVTMNTVITAAHCFWDNRRGLKLILPAEQFAVGAGKIYKPWSEPHDTYRQTSEISAIHIPPQFRGRSNKYQDDIALVQLTQTFTTSPAVFPACVSFDVALDEEQLASEKPGTVMGWGLTQEDGGPSQVLKYAELAPVPLDKCIEQTGFVFIGYNTSDKICAGNAGQALCKGDSGGGLVFIEDSYPPVPYLRGVASVAPRNEHACSVGAITGFTHVLAHRAFLLKQVPQLERDCQHRYPAAKVENKN